MISVGARRAILTGNPQRERWDLDQFLRAYDAVAVRRKGWAFERTPDRIAHVEREYARGNFRSLEEFAEERYELDQVYGDP